MARLFGALAVVIAVLVALIGWWAAQRQADEAKAEAEAQTKALVELRAAVQRHLAEAGEEASEQEALERALDLVLDGLHSDSEHLHGLSQALEARARRAEARAREEPDGASAGEPGYQTSGAAPVRASRTFLGPHAFPPEEYAAYGIVAFPALATAETRPRHEFICQAYLATLPRSKDLGVPSEQQMATVWPVSSEEMAKALDDAAHWEQVTCKVAVNNYHLLSALRALRDAEVAGADTSGRGPYLLAWSPASDKGNPDALVLRADLSGVTTEQQAMQILSDWRRDIEQDPSLWKDGWDMEDLAAEIRLWADKHGPEILALFGI
jgi:hypothetical protein